jgi:hypothetical protein
MIDRDRPNMALMMRKAVSLMSLGVVAACGGGDGTPPVVAVAPQPCSLRLPPRAAQTASVVNISDELYARAFVRLVPALCSCVPANEMVSIEARVRPERGEIRALAPGNLAATACLARSLNPGVFEPMDLGSGDCVNCGPRHFPPPRHPWVPQTGAQEDDAGASARGQGRLIVIPLVVDRKLERILDPNAWHVPDYLEGAGINE